MVDKVLPPGRIVNCMGSDLGPAPTLVRACTDTEYTSPSTRFGMTFRLLLEWVSGQSSMGRLASLCRV